MKKIIDVSKYKDLKIINVFGKNNTFYGFYRVRWNNVSDIDIACQIEIIEYHDMVRQETRYFKGFNELQALIGENVFGIDVLKDNYTDLRDLLSLSGYRTEILI